MSDICFDACTCGSVVVSSSEDVVDYIATLREANESLRAEVERLRAALEPFAYIANIVHPVVIDAMIGDGFFKHLENAAALAGAAQQEDRE